MVHQCVAYGHENVKDTEKKISLHPIPFENDQNPEAVRRQKSKETYGQIRGLSNLEMKHVRKLAIIGGLLKAVETN